MATQIEEIQSLPAETKQAARFPITKAGIEATLKHYQELTITGPDDKAGYERLRAGRITLKNTRISIEKRIDELIEPKKNDIKQIKSEGNELIDVVKPMEELLKEREDTYKEQVAEAERRRQEAVKAMLVSRKSRLADLDATYEPISETFQQYGRVACTWEDVRDGKDEEFEDILASIEPAFTAEQQRKADAKAKAEEEKVLREKQEAEAKAKFEQEKADREKQEADLARQREMLAAEQKRIDEQRAELDRLKKEQEAREAVKPVAEPVTVDQAPVMPTEDTSLLELAPNTPEIAVNYPDAAPDQDDLISLYEKTIGPVASRPTAVVGTTMSLPESPAEPVADQPDAVTADRDNLTEFLYLVSDLEFPVMTSKKGKRLVAELSATLFGLAEEIENAIKAL